ncbi:ribbon-helix-helix protein, CopG family [Thiohalophilus sp.]|uniref:ribbon-helix-helix protein, CopG family n=1 Tax=Thiohalophilus sp. TaxID=3028392 RepID=UPI002ACEC7AA|nr:ribbon-helix-helix protein, CopG family [Thiohalophilus sp.]MDZ7662601.1 ribbon-helix-helix protein, CopG family [Thiohalophilus sp.]
MSAISLRLPEEIETRLAEEARAEGRPRSEVIREAIAEYLTRHERERYMTRMVEAARAIAEDPAAGAETKALAEEAIESGNEAMDSAEGRQPGAPWPKESDENWWR